MLNHRITEEIYYSTKKRCYFASILFGKGVFKQMHRLFFRVRANDVNSTKSQPKVLYLMG